jgi:hypothetical protein
MHKPTACGGVSRRGFLAGTSLSAATLANPGLAAAQAVAVKPGDLPDLTIKEVRVYGAVELGNMRR